MESKKTSGDILLWLLTIGIVGYTAYRSVHLVQATMPESAKLMGYFALFALDAALLIWTWYVMHSAVSNVQVVVGYAMVYFQILAVGLAIVADTIMVFTGTRGELVTTIAAWAIPAIIVINVMAAVTCKIFSLESKNRRAGKEFAGGFEEGVQNWMKQNSSTLIAENAPAVAAARLQEQLAGLTGKTGKPGGGKTAQTGQPATSFAREEGKPNFQ